MDYEQSLVRCGRTTEFYVMNFYVPGSLYSDVNDAANVTCFLKVQVQR